MPLFQWVRIVADADLLSALTSPALSRHPLPTQGTNQTRITSWLNDYFGDKPKQPPAQEQQQQQQQQQQDRRL
jgi:hypothetical protein